MADWFARLMQKGDARARRALPGATFSRSPDGGRRLDARDARHDAVVRMLREREAEDREAREKRQLRYRQHLESESAPGTGDGAPSPPVRLYRFRTKVPCRVTPHARALLDQLQDEFPGGSVAFLPAPGGRQALMLTPASGAEPKQIGWVEQRAQTDPELCHVRHQGLEVETDGGAMLVLRFRYPATAVKLSSRVGADPAASPLPSAAGAEGEPTRGEGLLSRRLGEDGLELLGDEGGEVATVDFTELRPALDPRPADKGSSPPLVWVTRPEVETMNALASRDYEAFYVRFKLEVQAGLWSALSGLLVSSPGSLWHQGAYYTVVREPDATNGRIHQRTVADDGRTVDIGLDRSYDASAATDILLLYLGEDILADFADIYFTLQSLSSADAYFLKEEFFSVIRRFWASSQSLASRYGSELAAVVRMAQRTVPTPAQAPLLREDWTNLRQSLVDRYGMGGRNAAELVGQELYRPHSGPPTWPFASFPAGEVNIGLRLSYRQEWWHLGAQRGEVLRTVPAAQTSAPAAVLASTGRGPEDARVETRIEPGEPTGKPSEVVEQAARATAATMKWPLEAEGSINTGVRGLAAASDMGLEAECRESSRETSTRLSELMRRMAARIHEETKALAEGAVAEGAASSSSGEIEGRVDQDGTTYVYSRLQNAYEILTRPAAIENVVLVAERLPVPAEIDHAWVKRHDWILARVLLDESFREALSSIREEARPDPGVGAVEGDAPLEDVVKHMDSFSGTARVRADGIDLSGEWKRGYRDPAGEQLERLQRDVELEANRDRLYEHVRANILHYQRAIWAEEDPQQRSMRYRKSGRTLPLEWRFELESGGSLPVEELWDRLSAGSVEGQFAAYAGGREVELDQVIDPAGPIAFYGNYAVYRMRPEFGSEDLFAPLHFFKSPYLRPHPETGEPEVADPALIQIPDDPAAFRQERARRITLDTNGVVIDVLRRVDPPPDAAARVDLLQAPEGLEVILNSGRDIELLSPNGRLDPEGQWLFVSGGDPMQRLVAGAGGAAERAADPVAAPPILARGDLAGTPGLHAGGARDPDATEVLVWEERAPDLLAGAAPAPDLLADGAHRGEAEPVIVAGGAGAGTFELTGGVHPGSGAQPERATPALEAGAGTPLLLAGAARIQASEPARVIVAAADGATPALLAGASVAAAAAAQEIRGILAGGEGAPAPGMISGSAIARTEDGGPARGIVAGDEAWLRPSLVAG